MSPQPPRSPDAKGGGGPPAATAEDKPIDLFHALAKRLVRVPVSEVRNAERLYQASKAERQKDA